AKLLLLLGAVPFLSVLGSACFTPSASLSTARPMRKLIDPSASVTECENACTADTKCDAFSYVGTRCALLGAKVAESNLMIRDSGCAPPATTTTPTTTVSPTTTATTTTTSTRTTTTISPTTTVAATGTGCGKIIDERPRPCPTCAVPEISATKVNCPPGGYTFFYNDEQLLELKCVWGKWQGDGGKAVANTGKVHCRVVD
ncbi:hypothetical protein PFISCL1PPCAC_14167, partial [Pristionchus fissidentatus]